MNSQIKYIRLENGEVILFPAILEHDLFKDMNPISAGFCTIQSDRVDCFGVSYSLKLTADSEQDTLAATKQFLGIDAFIKLSLSDKNNGLKYPFSSTAFMAAWSKFIEYRSNIAHPLTEDIQQSVLNKLSSYNEDNAINMLSKTVQYGWIGLHKIFQEWK